MNTIYRYRSINENTLKGIINNELFFSNPLNFNDPFEFEYELDLEKLPESELAEHINKSELYKVFLQLKGWDLRKVEKAIFDKYVDVGYRENSKLKEMVSKRLGIACFSKKEDIFLMWSHYADMHRGICLGFNKDKLKSMITESMYLNDVDYQISVPRIRASIVDLGNTPENIKQITQTKLINWKYEEEVRLGLVLSSNNDRLFVYNPEVLESIILGCKISSEDKALIKKIINNDEKLSHVIIKEAKLDRGTSKLKIRSVDC